MHELKLRIAAEKIRQFFEKEMPEQEYTATLMIDDESIHLSNTCPVCACQGMMEYIINEGIQHRPRLGKSMSDEEQIVRAMSIVVDKKES